MAIVTATIGIIAALGDYAALQPALAAHGRLTLLDANSAVRAIDAGAIDILVISPRSDWWAELDDLSGTAAAAARTQLPVLALVPRDDAAALALAFDRGAADCSGFPADPAKVAIRVAALIRRKQVADRMRAEAAAVRRLALTDPVTGLWNRHHLDEQLAERIAAATAGGRPLSVMMIDVDHFKPINDRHGHVAGDKVLRTIATRLGHAVRAGDVLARFGGDELALVMPDTTLVAATVVGERLRQLVGDDDDALPCGVTISVGVAEYDRAEAAADLLARADKALYLAKLRGRNRVAAAS